MDKISFSNNAKAESKIWNFIIPLTKFKCFFLHYKQISDNEKKLTKKTVIATKSFRAITHIGSEKRNANCSTTSYTGAWRGSAWVDFCQNNKSTDVTSFNDMLLY